MEIAHEPHWLALLGDSKRVGAYLDAALERAQLVSGGDPAAAPAAFVAIEEPSHLHALFQTEPEAGRPAVVLAYPLPAGGPAVGVDVVAVDPADRGRAAIATADLGGAKLVYFELLHAPGPAEKTGPATVRFAGIALRLRTVARDELDRMGAGPTLAALVPAALAYPDKPSRPDWAAFYAEVRSAARVPFAAGEIFKLDLVLLATAVGELVATVYASEHAVDPGFEAAVGQVVSGVLWLSGHRVEPSITG
jgi:hypothetical protein